MANKNKRFKKSEIQLSNQLSACDSSSKPISLTTQKSKEKRSKGLRVMPDDQRFDNLLSNDTTGNEGVIEPVHSYESHIMTFEIGTRLRDNFFNVPCEILAKSLLGQTLVRSLSDGSVVRCKIVETECYLGGEDKASHSYNGRMTQRNMPMYMKPGTSYVYFTYGMYHCFNISCQGPGAAVLIRAAEPLDGLHTMQLHRTAHKKGSSKEKILKPHELCNGPSKLCMALAIERFTCNQQDLCHFEGLWIEKGDSSVTPSNIVSSPRIGIEKVGGEWSMKPLRFYILGNSSVSKRDKAREQILST